MQLQGIALAGLDEFMLRLGHLTVLAEASQEYGGYIHRVEKNVAARLTAPVTVDADNQSLIFYLRNKRLCRIDGRPEEPAAGDLRYPLINVVTQPFPKLETEDEDGLKVWWQDHCLSDPGIASRVGAITASARSGSKTGLSHIIDWAVSLGLISSNGESSAEANLINWLCRVLQKKENPYVIGVEKIVYAYLFFRGDIDIISRYCARLLTLGQPFDKSDAVDAFMEVVSEISDEATNSGALTARAQFSLLQIWRDLSKGTRTGSRGGSRSTAWHRCSSRLETLTDLGLLEKKRENGAQTFEYKYDVTERLSHCVRTFDQVDNVNEWIDRFLVETVTGMSISTPPQIRVEDFLPPAVESVGASIGLVPIDTMALSIAATAAYSGNPISLQQARFCIESASRTHSDVVRLARGTAGDRAEFASVNLRKLHE
jgi:hypothetical protein